MSTKLSKRQRSAIESFDRDNPYDASEAIDLVKSNAKAKFDETIEVAFRLGVDPRKADQIVRGTVSLPAGTGRTVRVAVFASGEKAREAEEAGADVIGGDELIDRVGGGWFEFDAAVATPDMMPKVGKIGKLLGPRGLMPNPKAGTVTTEVGKAVTDIKGGKVEYRTDKFGNVHLVLGKASFDKAALMRNFAAVLDEIIRAKPSAAKGKYVQGITVASTMGPGVKIDPNVTARDLAGEATR
jgi:large subunit ribosomal protein L1